MLISKEDFPTYCDFTVNTNDRNIIFHINRAEQFDLKPLIGEDLYEDLKNLSEENIVEWLSITSYSIGDKVIEDGVYYKAKTNNSNKLPSANTSDWGVYELGNFWKEYITPFVVLSAYVRYLVKLGANATQFGLTQQREETSEPVSDRRRSEILAEEKTVLNTYRINMLKYLSDNDYTIDGVVYEQQNIKSNYKFGIKAI